MEGNSEIAREKAILEIQKKISDIDAVINQEKNNKNKTRKTITTAHMRLNKDKHTLSRLVVEEELGGDE